MFYFLHGTDTIKAVDKSKQLLNVMIKKKPNASLFRIDSNCWSLAKFQELLMGQALFENKYIVQISRILNEEDINDVVLDNLEALQKSENVFIWVENKVDVKTLKKIETYSEKSQEFTVKGIVKKPEFNIFSLGDALGDRDKKRLWTLYIEALDHFVVQEIHGTLFWQVKSILLAFKTKSATGAGLKPFVYNNAKRFSKNYKEEEVEKLSSDLVKISHDARRGIHDFEIALEKFCLGI